MTARKKSRSPKRTKDPKGGLAAAGRERFRRTEGAHLKPGVKKRQSEMMPAERRIAAKGERLLAAYKRKSERRKKSGR